jgi:hypothetical protein
VQVPGTEDADGQGASDPTACPGKGKEKVETAGPARKVGSLSPPKDVGASSKQSAPPSKKRRLVCGDGSTISGPGVPQAPSRAAVDPAHGSDDGAAGTVLVGAGKTPRAPSDLKLVAKRATAATVAGGSSGGAAVTASAGVGKALRAPPPPRA